MTETDLRNRYRKKIKLSLDLKIKRILARLHKAINNNEYKQINRFKFRIIYLFQRHTK